MKELLAYAIVMGAALFCLLVIVDLVWDYIQYKDEPEKTEAPANILCEECEAFDTDLCTRCPVYKYKRDNDERGIHHSRS